MEDFYTNISQNESFNHSDTSYDYYNSTYILHYPITINVMTYVIIGIGLPLILVAIIALYSMIRNDHVAPIYVINLFISDVIQLCCMISYVTRPIAQVRPFMDRDTYAVYGCALAASVGFMVCIALERYLVIACPLWYHFRRTIKTSVVVCVLVWALGPIYLLAPYLWLGDFVQLKIMFVFYLFPLPLFIFFLVGTIRALSASISVPSDEKRRIVGVLVLVLLIYALLFMPTIISRYPYKISYDSNLRTVAEIFIRLSPPADLLLYVFMRKGMIDKLLASVCCCKMDSNDTKTSSP